MTKRQTSEYETLWDKANELGSAIDRHRSDLDQLNKQGAVKGKYVLARKRRVIADLSRLNNQLTPAQTSEAVIWQREAIIRARKFLVNKIPVNSRVVAQAVRIETGIQITDVTVDRFLNKIGWLSKKRGRPSK